MGCVAMCKSRAHKLQITADNVKVTVKKAVYGAVIEAGLQTRSMSAD